MTRIDPSLRALLDLPDEQRRIGTFVLVSPLGGPADAPVWRAQQWLEGEHVRDVAVKLFGTRGDAADPPEAGDRRRQHVMKDLRALVRLNHPNVVHFYELVTDDAHGVVGLVMELLEGASLEERIGQGPLPLADTLAVGVALAAALAAAHRANLCHRGVTPAHVVGTHGVHKLTDFAVAGEPIPASGGRRRMIVIPDLPLGLLGTHLRDLDGAVLRGEQAAGGSEDRPFEGLHGTIGYVDPVCVSELVEETEASDLYALGATLFACLTGAVPAVAAAGGAAIQGAVLEGTRPAPPLASKRPDAPPALAELVDALLDPRREKRPASAADVDAALRRIQAEPATQAAPGPRPAPGAPTPAGAPARPPQVVKLPPPRQQRTVSAKYVLLGSVALLVGGGGLYSYLSDRQVDREIKEDWSRVSACLLGPPLAPGEKPSVRVRNVELVVDSAPKSNDPNQWGGPWPNRCAPYVRNLRARLEKNNRADKFKHDVAWHLEQLAPEMERPPPRASVIDDTWTESVKEGLVAAPAPDVPPPPAPARPLFTIDAMDKLAPLAGPKGNVMESPQSQGNELALLVQDTSWRLCTITESAASCAPVAKEITPPVYFLASGDIEPGGDILLMQEPDYRNRSFHQKVFRASGELVAEALNLQGAFSRADANRTVTLQVLDDDGTPFLVTQEQGKPATRTRAKWLKSATYRYGLAFGGADPRYTTEDGKTKSNLDVPGMNLCKTATGLLLYGSEKVTVYQAGRWSPPVPAEVHYSRSINCADAAGIPTGIRLQLVDETKLVEERCSPAGCAKVEGGTGPLGAWKEGQFGSFAGRVALVWSTKDAAVKTRVAPIKDLAAAPVQVVFDGTVRDGAAGQLEPATVKLFARQRFAVMMIGTKTGQRLFRLGPDGSVTPLTL